MTHPAVVEQLRTIGGMDDLVHLHGHPPAWRWFDVLRLDGGAGLVQLVLTVVELLRQLMERQALRRVDQGDLSDQQVERLGNALELLAERMDQLKERYGLSDQDLNLDLGPLGPLLPRDL